MARYFTWRALGWPAVRRERTRLILTVSDIQVSALLLPDLNSGQLLIAAPDSVAALTIVNRRRVRESQMLGLAGWSSAHDVVSQWGTPGKARSRR